VYLLAADFTILTLEQLGLRQMLVKKVPKPAIFKLVG